MNRLLRWCVGRPVSVAAVVVAIVCVAGVATQRLPVTLLPEVKFPAVAIWTAYPGVAPGLVEELVTVPVERSVAGVAGVHEVNSRSMLGGSLVHVRFRWDVDLDIALLDVREQLDRIVDALPQGVEGPTVLRTDPTQRPVLIVALTPAAQEELGARRELDDWRSLQVVAEEVVARRIEQIPDVARVVVTGKREREVVVRPNLERMAALGVELNDLERAISSTNVSLLGGTVREGPYEFALELSGEYVTLQDVEQTALPTRGGVIYLADVAEVLEAAERQRGIVRVDGHQALLLLIERRPDGNAIEASSAVRRTLNELRSELPDVELDVLIDESERVRSAVLGASQAALIGAILAMCSLLFFLQRVRPLVAMAIAVPLSLGIALALFDLFDVSFNLLSLGGLALGAGLIVDNGIVVVENATRLREQGEEPAEAAVQGASGVAGAITASTLTTSAVFLPLAFSQGLAGPLFRDQSIAVVCALIASLFVALFIIPSVLAVGTVGRSNKASNGPNGKSGRIGSRLKGVYKSALAACIRRPYGMALVGLLVVVGGGVLTLSLPRQVVPPPTSDRLITKLSLSPESTLERVVEVTTYIEDAVRVASNQVRHVVTEAGERDEARLQLTPRATYESEILVILGDADPSQVAESIRGVQLPPDAELEVSRPREELEELLGVTEGELVVELTAETRRLIDEEARGYADRLSQSAAFEEVGINYGRKLPVYQLHTAPEVVARWGIRPEDVHRLVEAATRGRLVSSIRGVSEEVPLLIRTQEGTLDDLMQQSVPTPAGVQVPLADLVRLEQVEESVALLRGDQRAVVRVAAVLEENVDLQEAEQLALEAAASLSPGIRIQLGGSSERFRETVRAAGTSLLFSLLLVYLILAAQFESVRQPLIVLATVPVALAGVAGILWLTSQSLNLLTLTGAVILVGIVVNDAIIKVDLTNQLRKEGMTIREAVTAASEARLRPVLMTTITTVFGLLPLALGIGEGETLRAPLAIAVAGGLATATALTVFLVPSLYILSYGKRTSRRGER